MGRFYGAIGYLRTVEDSQRPGVFVEELTERKYYGDVIDQARRWDKGDSLNDDISLNNRISIVADAFACENLGCMRYVVLMGDKWKISNAVVQRPRIILTVGGVYNG